MRNEIRNNTTITNVDFRDMDTFVIADVEYRGITYKFCEYYTDGRCDRSNDAHNPNVGHGCELNEFFEAEKNRTEGTFDANEAMAFVKDMVDEELASVE